MLLRSLRFLNISWLMISASVVLGNEMSVSQVYYQDWPRILSEKHEDLDLEEKIREILSQMTLEEKVGQMIQPDLREVTIEEAGRYKLGSILNGGGAWPLGSKYSLSSDWVNLADEYFNSVAKAFEGRGFTIPFMWATDAVHGHNNVYGATLFPHNIGLGSAHDPDLIRRIGIATAREIAVTGLDWSFSPTVAVPQNLRWGRVYEGYSQDPQITSDYAREMVLGLQGELSKLGEPGNVISTLKHWVGDGGTLDGIDRGQNHDSEIDLINTHARGYFAGIEAGAQVVMVSFNSWVNPKNVSVSGDAEYNYKIHGSGYLIRDVLKGKLGFDGIVITDWNGHAEVAGCRGSDCPDAVLAGNDIIMVTARSDWKAFYGNLLSQVRSGLIPIDRIDDAVTRILRVKMRAGLWEKPSPKLRMFSGRQELLNSQEHRNLAREAVRKSLVLLKNDQGILPLRRDANYVVVGSAARDIQKQTGGWSLTWQGNENDGLLDFPGAKTIFDAVSDEVGHDRVFASIESAPDDAIAIVVIGEEPYAEMLGDISPTKTLEYSRIKKSYGKDLALLRDLSEHGLQIVTVFFSGRPLYVNEEINLSTAFIAGWLPGTAGEGVTDLLFANGDHDFTGRLSFAWPGKKCDAVLAQSNRELQSNENGFDLEPTDDQTRPLFPLGYGLSYAQNRSDTFGIDTSHVALDERDYGCGFNAKDQRVASDPIRLFGVGAEDDFTMLISGASTNWAGIKTSNGSSREIREVATTPIDFIHQQDGLLVEFSGYGPGQIYLASTDGSGSDLQRFVNADGALKVNFALTSQVPDSLILAMHCGWPCKGEVNLIDFVADKDRLNNHEWVTASVPLALLEEDGMSFLNVTAPFLIFSDSELELLLGNIEIAPGP